MEQPVRIGIVAGEASGDQLGGALIPALRQQLPGAVFEGIGGPQMLAAGFTSLFPIERLSVMGFVEPLKRLPELLRIRHTLYRHFRDTKADLVIGIDSPDFNLGLELHLKRLGIATAHYVSPSVWAWRQGRIHKIARAVDQVLCLLPFEAEFYEKHQIPATFVGHPLADCLPLEPDTRAARQQLGLADKPQLVALLPGSRGSEVAMLGPLFLDVVRWCRERIPDLHFVIPAANPQRRQDIEALMQGRQAGITLIDGNAHQAMEAADAVLLASGTTALEAMLLKKPMVVSYRLGPLSYKILSRLIQVPYISLPNLLAGKPLVPELVQDQATVEAIGAELLKLLGDPEHNRELAAEFTRLHQLLQRDASRTAAAALARLVKQ